MRTFHAYTSKTCYFGSPVFPTISLAARIPVGGAGVPQIA